MKTRLLLLSSFLPSLLLLSACTTQPKAARYEPPVVVVAPHNVVDEMLAYHQDLLRMPRAELSREFDRLTARPRDLHVTLRKAMVLGQLARKGDFARAQSNLAEVLSDPSVEAQQIKPLAQLLATHYAAAQRMSEQLESNERALADSQHRLSQLSQTLEQLKAVERSLPSRSGTASTQPEVQQDKK